MWLFVQRKKALKLLVFCAHTKKIRKTYGKNNCLTHLKAVDRPEDPREYGGTNFRMMKETGLLEKDDEDRVRWRQCVAEAISFVLGNVT